METLRIRNECLGILKFHRVRTEVIWIYLICCQLGEFLWPVHTSACTCGQNEFSWGRGKFCIFLKCWVGFPTCLTVSFSSPKIFMFKTCKCRAKSPCRNFDFVPFGTDRKKILNFLPCKRPGRCKKILRVKVPRGRLLFSLPPRRFPPSKFYENILHVQVADFPLELLYFAVAVF